MKMMADTKKKKVQVTRSLEIIGGPDEFAFRRVADLPQNEDCYDYLLKPMIITSMQPQKRPVPAFYLQLSDGRSYRVEKICVDGRMAGEYNFTAYDIVGPEGTISLAKIKRYNPCLQSGGVCIL